MSVLPVFVQQNFIGTEQGFMWATHMRVRFGFAHLRYPWALCRFALDLSIFVRHGLYVGYLKLCARAIFART